MKKFVIAFALLLASGGVAFTSLGGMSYLDQIGLRGSERHLRARLAGYWEARLHNDMQDMARYLHPLDTALMQPGVLVTESYEIKNVAMQGERAVATIKLRSRVKQAGFSTRSREVTVSDPWVRYEGNWYQEPGPVTFEDAIKQSRGLWTPPGTKAPAEPAVAQ